jgi:hypothetical protein
VNNTKNKEEKSFTDVNEQYALAPTGSCVEDKADPNPNARKRE